MAWLVRGVRDGIVTTRYPRRPDDYGEGFEGTVVVKDPQASGEGLQELCPTGAITIDGEVRLDRGRCITCGRCVAKRPDVFSFSPELENARIARSHLVVPEQPEEAEALDRLRRELASKVRSFKRSLHVRHVDAGSDGSEEWELAALLGPVYDVHRLGIFFTASPRHADLLLVTGACSIGMIGPLRRTYEAMAEPRVVLAAGADAISGGLVYPTWATARGIASVLQVDVFVPGSPPSPFSLLHGILLAMGVMEERRAK